MQPQDHTPTEIFGETSQIMDLSHLGILRVSGNGAKKLLQGQLTCDLEELSENQTRLGAYCLPQGRMISLFRIFQWQQDYYLQMSAEILPETLATLKKYGVFFKVILENASASLSRFSYSGINAEAELQKVFSTLPSVPDAAVICANTLIVRMAGELPHYELICPVAERSPLYEKLIATAKPARADIWKYLNLTAGIPDLYTATTGKLLPHDVNLPRLNGVSFNKGCYTGQEIVARMHYRGQLKKQMYRGRVNLAERPVPGSDIFNPEACGMIIDSCHENANTYQILFLTDKNSIENEQLFADFAKISPIELLTLPE
jgi:folate-binding protein YgfZ